MAINKNHEFEELDGIKCAIVQKNASAERVEFLKEILNYNAYTVVVVATPVAPAKPAPIAAAPDALPAAEAIAPAPPPPVTYTIGVTDLTFNPTNAIFGRLLKAPNGHYVTLAYWNQKENEPHDEIPYYESIA
jgi:hypothetical protein